MAGPVSAGAVERVCPGDGPERSRRGRPHRVVDGRLSDTSGVVVADTAHAGIAAEARGRVERTGRLLAVSRITTGQVEPVSEMLAPLEVADIRRHGDWATVPARPQG